MTGFWLLQANQISSVTVRRLDALSPHFLTQTQPRPSGAFCF
jgi:hypothetical protein